MNIKNLAVGIDIEDINRFDKYSTDKKNRFLEKIYTKSEIDYCFSYKTPSKHLAARYCAKEACVKALTKLGIKDVYYNQIEVYRDNFGGVSIRLLEKKKYSKIFLEVSLSHSKSTAAANVLAIELA